MNYSCGRQRDDVGVRWEARSEEHTSELQSPPTRRSSDLRPIGVSVPVGSAYQTTRCVSVVSGAATFCAHNGLESSRTPLTSDMNTCGPQQSDELLMWSSA